MARIFARTVDGHQITRIPYGTRGTSLALLMAVELNHDRAKIVRWRQGPNRWSQARWISLEDCADPEGDKRIPDLIEAVKAESSPLAAGER